MFIAICNKYYVEGEREGKQGRDERGEKGEGGSEQEERCMFLT